MIATIYSRATGVIRAVIDTPDMKTLLLNIGADELVVAGSFDAATHYITSARPVAYPPRPGDWAVWDGHNWTDPRSQADLTAALEAQRTAASMDKGALLIGLMGLGIIGADEAREAGRTNTIPPTIAAAMDDWPAAARATEEITWAVSASINRNQAVIAAAIITLDLDPVAVDRLFGLET